jgi:hypothetical protein
MKGKIIIFEPFEVSQTFLSNLPSIVSNQHQYNTDFEAKWLYFLGNELPIDHTRLPFSFLTRELSHISGRLDYISHDASKSNAVESSLWEMETLSSHYHLNVATLAKIFSQSCKKQSNNMEDFLDWGYTLLASENTRRLKTEVALEYETFHRALGDHLKEWKW